MRGDSSPPFSPPYPSGSPRLIRSAILPFFPNNEPVPRLYWYSIYHFVASRIFSLSFLSFFPPPFVLGAGDWGLARAVSNFLLKNVLQF